MNDRYARREAIGLTIKAAGSLAGSLTLLAAMGRAQAGSPRGMPPSALAVEDAANRFRQVRTLDAFMTWTERLREWGDIEQVRVNLKQLEPSRAEWGSHRPRIEALGREVCYQEYRAAWTIPASRLADPMWRDPLVISLPIPRQSYEGIPKTDVSIDGVKSWSFKTDAVGNRYIEAVRHPRQDVQLSYTVTLGLANYRKRLQNFMDTPVPAEMSVYLEKTWSQNRRESIDPGGKRAQEAASSLRLQNMNLLERLETILKWAKDNVKWLPPGSERAPIDSESALGYGGGHCMHQTCMIAAVARAAGIPTRQVRGNASVVVGSKYPLWHSTPEFYLPGIEWITPYWANERHWDTLHGCVWMFHTAGTNDAILGNLQFLEAVEYNPAPRIAISSLTLLREWL